MKSFQYTHNILRYMWHFNFKLLMKYNFYANFLSFGTNSTSEINVGRYINHQIENICSDKGMSQNLLKINILSTAICQSTYFHTREPCHSSNNIIYFLFYCLTFFSNLFIYQEIYILYTFVYLRALLHSFKNWFDLSDYIRHHILLHL